MKLAEIEARLNTIGLLSRGAFHPRPDDGVPGLSDGRETQTVVLAGNAGPSMWSVFIREKRKQIGHPLNAWTRAVLAPLAEAIGGQAVYPFEGPPYHPFQRWAQRAEPVFPSPIGPLIHPDYGLWHAYRGAILVPERLAFPVPERRPSPCDSCTARPCLTACPAGVLGADGYDVGGCAEHVASVDGGACRNGGCLARHACPVGREFVYGEDQARFHMAAFLRGRPQ